MTIRNDTTFQVVYLCKTYTFTTPWSFQVWAKDNGFTHTGTSHSEHRKELDGQPKFKELIGPMYGGAGQARYESPAAYAKLSV